MGCSLRFYEEGLSGVHVLWRVPGYINTRARPKQSLFPGYHILEYTEFTYSDKYIRRSITYEETKTRLAIFSHNTVPFKRFILRCLLRRRRGGGGRGGGGSVQDGGVCNTKSPCGGVSYTGLC